MHISENETRNGHSPIRRTHRRQSVGLVYPLDRLGLTIGPFGFAGWDAGFSQGFLLAEKMVIVAGKAVGFVADGLQ